ncbi:hypothetical protein C0J52_06531 [Blattella germanica]|nr:hypothetical protein C0J52_06531 [Blattella germanica]
MVLTYGELLENTQTCDVVVHQGYSKDDVYITQLLCVKSEQIHHCKDCEVSLNPDDSILKKYVNAILKALQKKTGKTSQLTGVQQASYKTLDDGILYKIIITVTNYGKEQMGNQACEAVVHQGYQLDAINVKKLKCVKAGQVNEQW